MLDRGKPPEPELIDIDRLVRDDALQPRADMDEATVAEYQRTMREGARFPPVDAVETPDGSLLLADGWHRVEAAEREGYTKLRVRVWFGTHDDAVEFACASNAKHGLRRTEADLAKVVSMLRLLPKWRQASNVEVANHVGVSEWTIRHLRGDLEDTNAAADPASTRMVRRGGQQYPMKVGRIGKAQERQPVADPKPEPDATFGHKPNPAPVMLRMHQDAATLSGAEVSTLIAEWVRARTDVSLAVGSMPDIVNQLGRGVAARGSISLWARGALNSARANLAREVVGMIIDKKTKRTVIAQLASGEGIPVRLDIDEVHRIVSAGRDEMLDAISLIWSQLEPADRQSLKEQWGWQIEARP